MITRWSLFLMWTECRYLFHDIIQTFQAFGITEYITHYCDFVSDVIKNISRVNENTTINNSV